MSEYIYACKKKAPIRFVAKQDAQPHHIDTGNDSIIVKVVSCLLLPLGAICTENGFDPVALFFLINTGISAKLPAVKTNKMVLRLYTSCTLLSDDRAAPA